MMGQRDCLEFPTSVAVKFPLPFAPDAGPAVIATASAHATATINQRSRFTSPPRSLTARLAVAEAPYGPLP